MEVFTGQARRGLFCLPDEKTFAPLREAQSAMDSASDGVHGGGWHVEVECKTILPEGVIYVRAGAP